MVSWKLIGFTDDVTHGGNVDTVASDVDMFMARDKEMGQRLISINVKL